MRGFWAGRKVFVTGHTGFKGSWLCIWLKMLGADVAGYSVDVPTEPSLFELAGVTDAMESITGDVRDIDCLSAAIGRVRPEIVIHLAAQSLVRRSYDDPIGTYATNVMGTVNLMEAVRRCDSLQAVVSVTSDKCYANRSGKRSLREDDPMGGRDPYSSSKGCAELVTSAYRHSFFASGRPAVASARAGNVIGGGDWAQDRLLPDFFRAMNEDRSIVIRNPDAVRPWQHVLEPLSGYLLLAEQLCGGKDVAEGWNFGPDEADAIPVSEVMDRVAALWSSGAAWTRDAGDHPYEAPFLRLDCSRARSRLGWRPRTDIDQALRWTVQWHKRLAGPGSALTLCQEQIADFMALPPRADEPATPV